jgi:CheY-like chemotaxis protein/HPt (histidine-containing phosphotransfer) domain-containing protein
LQTKLSPKQRDYVGKIHRAGQSLLGLINDILDFSKIEAGKLDVEVVAFSLDEVLANIATITSQKAADKQIEYLFHVAPDVPRHLRGDPLRLGQVLVNLVNNAVKFTDPNGEIAVDIRALERGGDTALLRFSVRDSGIGMTEEQQSRLFQPFSQADDSTTRKYGGTGLGLSISHRLVELMGGSIGVESALGQGSNFHFDLRFDIARDEPTTTLPEGMGGARILVVDDSAPDRAVLAENLSAMKLRVDAVESAAAALAAIHNADADQPYRVVFTDWQMPEMDGLALIRAVKTGSELRRPPTMVLVTAFNHDDVQRQADQAGADGLLFKPIGPSVLHDTLAEVFVSHRSTLAGQTSDMLTGDHAGARILLAEDNAINQQIASELLAGMGIAVDIAEDGQQAVKLATDAPPGHYAMILMDLQMPIMDGHAATAALRTNRMLDNTPIVALTAHAISDVRQRCLDEGMQDFLTKPLSPEQLNRAVQQWITPRKSAPATPPMPAAAGLATTDASPPDFSKFTEFDVAQGLRYMGGKHRLLWRLLGRFLQGEADAVASVQAAIDQGDWAAAQRRVHTLKGLAGSMGATKVQAAADALEHLLEQTLANSATADTAMLAGRLADLAGALSPLLDELRAHLPATAD